MILRIEAFWIQAPDDFLSSNGIITLIQIQILILIVQSILAFSTPICNHPSSPG